MKKSSGLNGAKESKRLKKSASLSSFVPLIMSVAYEACFLPRSQLLKRRLQCSVTVTRTVKGKGGVRSILVYQPVNTLMGGQAISSGEA